MQFHVDVGDVLLLLMVMMLVFLSYFFNNISISYHLQTIHSKMTSFHHRFYRSCWAVWHAKNKEKSFCKSEAWLNENLCLNYLSPDTHIFISFVKQQRVSSIFKMKKKFVNITPTSTTTTTQQQQIALLKD